MTMTGNTPNRRRAPTPTGNSTWRLQAIAAALSLCFIHLASGRAEDAMTPQAMAKLVGDAIVRHKDVFLVWNYGGALVVDGLWKANETFQLNYADTVDALLTHYLSDAESFAYKAVHGESIPHGGTIGDSEGLFPIAYLNRALSYSHGPAAKPGYSNVSDFRVAEYIARNYVLNWPVRLSDGCVARDHGWAGQSGHDSFLWGDDQYMGLTLASRLAIMTGNLTFAQFVGKQTPLFFEHMRDPQDGLFYHGYNAADKEESCCKWGRGNGWGLFSHVEVLAALERFPALSEQTSAVTAMLQERLDAALQFQSPDGRWHQLVNDTDSFLETSVTAMFTSALARTVINKWANASSLERYTAAARKGFAGLTKTVDPDTGEVSGVCSGTGIQTNADAYRHRPTVYLASGPGGLGSVLSAAVDIYNMEVLLQSSAH